MKKIDGFTLLEVLVALTVFAILATITSSSLYYAFNTRNLVNAHADRLNKIQMAVSILQQDCAQMVDRAIRGNEMRLFPILIGQSQYMEFTRGGISNPKSMEKRSTLKRIGIVCSEDTLIHRTWSSLDPKDRHQSLDRVLLDNVSACEFSYLNHNVQSLPEWREQAQGAEVLPTAIQIKLTINDWGKINLLFIIPEAFYASN